MPALVVRDQGYQPVLPRLLAPMDDFLRLRHLPIRANPGPSCPRSPACSVMTLCSIPQAPTGTTSLLSSRILGHFSTRPPPPSPQ
ncbi:hypothetical protein HRG_014607 [Hirsutella rhossiliensis]